MIDKITKARTGLILDSPFFGALALRLKLIEDPTCKTAYTDGKVIGYNPAFVKSLNIDQVKGLLAHEVMHVACCHHTRRKNRDHKKWNSAADYAINQILVDSGFSMPEGALLHHGFKDLSADEIYNRIPDEQGDDEPENFGEVRDCPGEDGKQATPQEIEAAETEAKITATQAANIAKAAGKLGGSLERLVSSLLKPVIDWRSVLSRFVQASAKNDYTWTKPAPRYMASGLYMPALQSEEMGPIVLAIDTSGSISQTEIDQFSAELQTIMDECRPEKLTVIYCDYKVNGTEEFFQNDEIKLELKGGGGTRFSPVFSEVEERGEDPACLVYLTDGECNDFPEHAPDYHVLWSITGKVRFSPPFGEVLSM